MEYQDFFFKATGKEPFPYQVEFATSASIPDILEAPTGAGKTATVVVSWLWRRFLATNEIHRSTPSRLVYCLPMRVLVEQTFNNVKDWLEKSALEDKVGLHVLMGGEDAGDWNLKPERPFILVGTQDMLLSRVLNRGYGTSRYRWPIDFGLLNNDCLWVLHEVQLMGNGLATTTQLQAFHEIFGTIAPCKSIWMSATFQRDWLKTVDFRKQVASLTAMGITHADREVVALEKRLVAPKTLKSLNATSTDASDLAQSIRAAHHPGTLTLVVVNTVSRAVELFKAIKKGFTIGPRRDDEKKDLSQPEVLLLHSRFRPPEKDIKVKSLLGKPSKAGRIAVTTQVVEAGVDVSAKTLFTDLAPWASLIQRFGRCNRYGEFDEATIFWIDVLQISKTTKKGTKKSDAAIEKEKQKAALPYVLNELEESRAQLQRLDHVSPVALAQFTDGLDSESVSRLFPYDPLYVIRKKDLVELFDTTPDISGNDIDVSRFIREGADLDVQVYWRELGNQRPSDEEEAPKRLELCPVPVYEFRAFVDDKGAFHWDHLEGNWRQARSWEVLPGHIYLIPAYQGGYDLELGWNRQARNHVVTTLKAADLAQPDANSSDKDSTVGSWQRISEHTEIVCEQLEHILASLGFELDEEVEHALSAAARWHDRGKAHSQFVEAIQGGEEHEGNDWAKAPTMRRYTRKGFRHELASALATLQAGQSDLATYLVASHHGKVRLSIRSWPNEKRPPDPALRFARGVWDDDELPSTDLGGGVTADRVALSLEVMELGQTSDGRRSWIDRMLNLLNDPELGPFKLAFLESILRAADIRGSAIPLKSNLNGS